MKKIFGLGLILIAIDQLSKLIVANTIPVNQTVTIIKDFFYLTNLKNTGAAWSILEGRSAFLVILGIAAIIFIISLIKDEKNLNTIHIISYGLLLGGIAGNLIDRIYLGGVIDFIYIELFNFPIFNISDMCIVCGVIIFTFETIRSDLYGKTNRNKKLKNR